MEQLTSEELSVLPKQMAAFMENAPTLEGANQVQVEPGGATFTTIQAALNSITDASQQKQYALYISGGTFNEALTLKPWCFLIGAGTAQTIVTYPGTYNTDGLQATIIAASNCGIGNMIVNSTYAPNVIFSNGIRCDDAVNFNIANVVVNTEDSPGTAGSMLPIYNNFGGYSTGPCNVVISSSAINAQCQNSGTYAIGVWAVSNGTYQIFNSKIVVSGSTGGVGICANPGPGSNVTVDDSTVNGVEFSLLGSSNSTLIANGCTLNGPVGPDVVVNP